MSVARTEPLRFEGAAANALAVDVFGQGGQPVLFLHGGGQTRHAWSRAAESVVQAGMRAYCADQRGHGDSDWVTGGAYTVDDFGDDAAALARAVADQAGQPPLLVGASLGGLAGLAASLSSPRSILAGLILVDVTPSLNIDGLLKIERFMSARMEAGFASVEEAAQAVADYLPARAKPASLDGLRRNLRLREDGRLRWHWDPAFLNGPRSVMSEGAAGVARLRQAAGALAVPTLLVRGAQSDVVTMSEVAEFRALAPHADFIDVAGAGHMVAGDRNDVFVSAILGFLGRQGYASIDRGRP